MVTFKAKVYSKSTLDWKTLERRWYTERGSWKYVEMTFGIRKVGNVTLPSKELRRRCNHVWCNLVNGWFYYLWPCFVCGATSNILRHWTIRFWSFLKHYRHMWLEGCPNPHKMEQSWECTFWGLFTHMNTNWASKKYFIIGLQYYELVCTATLALMGRIGHAC